MISKAMQKRIEKMATEDFQGRGLNGPEINIPVFVNVWERHTIKVMEVEFKNTSEAKAISVTEKLLKTNKVGDKRTQVTAYQNGDYPNDWVMVVVEFWSHK